MGLFGEKDLPHMAAVVIYNVTLAEYDKMQTSVRGFGAYQKRHALVMSFRIFLTALGLVGNVFSFIVFTRRTMDGSINILLAALEASNFINFFVDIDVFVEFFWFEYYITYAAKNMLIAQKLFTDFGFFMSGWLSVSIAIWRLLAIRLPLRTDHYTSRTRAIKVVAIVGTLCFIFIILPQAFLISPVKKVIIIRDVGREPINQTVYTLEPTEIANSGNLLFLRITYCYKIILSMAGPCICLAVLNTCIVFEIWKVRRKRLSLREIRTHVRVSSRREQRITVSLLMFLVLQFFAYLIYTVRLVWIVVDHETPYDEDLDTAVIFTLLIWNDVSFFCYFYMGQKFRNTFMSLFWKKQWIQKSTRELASGQTNLSMSTGDLR